MTERRNLVEGLKATPDIEAAGRQFVFGGKQRSVAPAATANIGKAPISTRIRADYAQALKRASLERQLEGVTPNSLQKILEAALEPWLREHGYLPGDAA